MMAPFRIFRAVSNILKPNFICMNIPLRITVNVTVGSIRCFSRAQVKKVVEEKVMLKNDKIKFPTMRVIFNNAETGKSEWKIMNRLEALTLAKDMRLDLLLGKRRIICLFM
jgi:hypothetical protein